MCQQNQDRRVKIDRNAMSFNVVVYLLVQLSRQTHISIIDGLNEIIKVPVDFIFVDSDMYTLNDQGNQLLKQLFESSNKISSTQLEKFLMEHPHLIFLVNSDI